MAIGTITVGSQGGQAASAPLRVIPLSFAADDSYPSGGTAGFEASIQAKLGEAVTLLGIIPMDCGGYVPCYDRGNDKLKVYVVPQNPNKSPLIEVDNAMNLSDVTFVVLALCK